MNQFSAAMKRLLAVGFIIFCFEVGLFLIIVPWSSFWENNFLLSYVPDLRPLVLNNFFRGAVSGLGVIDFWIGITEVEHFRKRSHTSGRIPG